jgi:hypothetical protein
MNPGYERTVVKRGKVVASKRGVEVVNIEDRPAGVIV